MKEIKDLYSQLNNKSEFVDVVSEKFNKNPGTVRNHWLYGNAMPLEYQKEFRRLLKKAVKNQTRFLENLK